MNQLLFPMRKSPLIIALLFLGVISVRGQVVPTPQSVREVPPFVAAAVGDPSAIVDSVYDFASQLLTLNKQFVHQLLEAAEPAGAKQTKASAAKKSDA